MFYRGVGGLWRGGKVVLLCLERGVWCEFFDGESWEEVGWCGIVVFRFVVVGVGRGWLWVFWCGGWGGCGVVWYGVCGLVVGC